MLKQARCTVQVARASRVSHRGVAELCDLLLKSLEMEVKTEEKIETRVKVISKAL